MASQSENNVALAIRIPASQSIPELDDKMDIDEESTSSATEVTSEQTLSSRGTLVGEPERTPSPVNEPETYADWGREQFGEEWFRQRNVMLNERNIFLSPDPVYKQRQSALRMHERDVEGRTFMLPHGMDGKPTPPPSHPTSPTTAVGTSHCSSLFGSAPPSSQVLPSSSQIIPSSQPDMDDPWQRLEYYRQKHQWDDLEYHIEKYLLEEALIDQTRSKREDELGNRRLEDELEAMHDLQKTSPVYRRQRRRFEMRTVGWSEEDDVDDKKDKKGKDKEEEAGPSATQESDSDSVFDYGEDSSDEDVIS
ncbi:hypothetical protein F4806DRAFT_501788 [Annulohypoxylon nitens]|nr:hypothetical protein F4806DRAFT_501788 [Annulohypoxylon nitens]